MTTSALQPPAPPPGFNPLSQEFLSDPYPMLERARNEAPVFFSPEMGFWAITRHADIVRALADWKTFSNQSLANVPVPPEFADRIAPDWFASGALIPQDPPGHTVRRKFINKGFGRRQMAALEEPIEQICNDLIDSFIDDGQCDLMRTYCYQVSLRSIVLLLGMPTDDLPLLHQLVDDQACIVSDTISPMGDEERLERWERFIVARSYLSEVVQQRRVAPQDDLVSLMASATDGQGSYVLSPDQVITHLTELLMAGTETTANLMAHTVMLLDENPEQLAALKHDPGLWPQAAEEGQRRRSPAIGIVRVTTCETVVAGVTIPAGAVIWLALAAAGHDESVFPDPRSFDIHRDNVQEHISFGKGRHFCLGAPLTRVEAPIGLRVLYERIPDLRVVPNQTLQYEPIYAVLVLRHLQATWGAGGSAA